MSQPISPELRRVLRELKISPILETLPERLVLARQQKLPYQEFLELVLADEAPSSWSRVPRSAAGMLPSSKASW